MSLNEVLWNAPAFEIHQPQIELAPHFSLIRSLPVPFQCFVAISENATSPFIGCSQLKLCFCIALFGSLNQALDGRSGMRGLSLCFQESLFSLSADSVEDCIMVLVFAVPAYFFKLRNHSGEAQLQAPDIYRVIHL
jgi:hypothetical protein